MTAREFLRAHMHAISETYLAHDATIDERNGLHVCPCGMRGTEAEWEQHVADTVADLIGDVPVQQPLMEMVL
ncbi:hypothetical protein [Mycolicibacterium sphagni]|uniref:Uncharacterized protein n=1 Tax=Mycolicibacterium sphagni TaxID=1786 RepID=A0A255DBM8_9MYCO|nr:hypothetical protein [Mycolicibacterium sphagni]OYN76828.1 hypothetical protein CG716_20150 [Mycolicibacterium sphagni]